ncbi:MAG: metallopeptidase family protein [Planctomycetota bacterium]
MASVSRRERDLFDRLLDAEVDALPEALRELLERVPLIVDDEPTPRLLESLGMSAADDADLCGLHEGVPLTERSVEDVPDVPEQMMLFRGPILRLADYPERGPTAADEAELRRQVHITLLHEMGHHFGLDEDDLEALGYA